MELPNIFGVITTYSLNVFFSRDVGSPSRTTGLQVASQSVARLYPLIEPGFEYYAGIEDVGAWWQF